MKPAALQPGDTIGVMAPSSYVEREDIERAKAIVEAKGFKVFVHPQTFERENQSAGTTLQKSLAFQGLWQRDDIKAIWCAGGGNRAMHVLDSINFKAIEKKPKILIGFSDNTVLLNGLYAHTKMPSIHGPVFKNLDKYNEWDDLLALLSGKTPTYTLDTAVQVKQGHAEGVLVGGNLSLFQYLPQTLPGDFYKDAILFLEDVNEEPSKLDRMFHHLKRTGVLKNIAGLILGDFGDLKETGRPFGYSLLDIIIEYTDELSIPIVMNAPFGHGKQLLPLPVGVKSRLIVENTTEISIREPVALTV